jgi:hypothetical protein
MLGRIPATDLKGGDEQFVWIKQNVVSELKLEA